MRRLIIIAVAVLSCIPAVRAQEPIFLFPEFTKATFTFRQGRDVCADFNFDTKGQKLYFMQDGVTMEMTNTHRIDTVKADSRKFVFHDSKFCEYIRCATGDIYINWHLRDSFTGKVGAMGLTTQGKVEVMQVPGLNSEYSFDNIGKYEDRTDVWVIRNENTYYFTYGGAEYRFRHVSDLCKAMPDRADKIKAFAKAENITVKNAAEAMALINHIYSL